MKRHRNAARLAEQHDDPDLRDRLTAIREALADHLVVIAHQIRTEIEDLGYSAETDIADDQARPDTVDSSGLPAPRLVPGWAPEYDDGRGSLGSCTNESS